MAGPRGFEPRRFGSEPNMLPLHQGPKMVGMGGIEPPAFPFQAEPSADDNTPRNGCGQRTRTSTSCVTDNRATVKH